MTKDADWLFVSPSTGNGTFITLTPENNKFYRDQVEETYLLISPEDKKKMMKGKGKKGKKKKK